MLEVEVQPAAGGPHHRGNRVAVLLQFGLAFGPVYVEDQDARERAGYDTDPRPGQAPAPPSWPCVLRYGRSSRRFGSFERALIGMGDHPRRRYSAASRAAHAAPSQSSSANGKAASTSNSSSGVESSHEEHQDGELMCRELPPFGPLAKASRREARTSSSANLWVRPGRLSSIITGRLLGLGLVWAGL